MRHTLLLSSLLALLLVAPAHAEEHEVLVEVDGDRVEVTCADGARYRLKGQAAETLGRFPGRRVRVEGTFSEGQAQLRQLLYPTRLETQAVVRQGLHGPLTWPPRLVLPDGRVMTALGPASHALGRAMDQEVRVRVWVFAAEGELYVEGIRAVVTESAFLKRQIGPFLPLPTGPNPSVSFPVNRVRAGTEVWIEEGTYSVRPPKGRAGLIDPRKLDFFRPPTGALAQAAAASAGLTGALGADQPE